MSDDPSRASQAEEDPFLLPQRVEIFLQAPENDDETVREFLDKANVKILELGRQLRMTLWLAIGLAGLFAILSGKGVSEVTLMSVKLTDFSLVRIFIPPAVAGLTFRALLVAHERGVALDVYRTIVEHRFPGTWRSGLWAFPLTSALPISTGVDAITEGTRYASLLGILETVEQLIAIFLLPAVFAAYAFYRLFSSYGLDHVIVWLSLAATVGTLILAFICRGGPEIHPIEKFN